jgi:hypothetical protein
MQRLNPADITGYVEENIGLFHNKRLARIERLKLYDILKRKNPYLFKAKNVLTAQDLVKYILDAYLSSQEETIFGEFLEGLAIFINHKVYGGRKSSAEGIDLEFERDQIKYIVSIKSGPNWGNSRQIAKMKEDFIRAQRVLRSNNPDIHIKAVNGCCYGKDNHPDKGSYFKYCGQTFWHFISGEQTLYTGIIEPLGHRAKEKNDQFQQSYSRILNKFTLEFGAEFCVDGLINWAKLVHYNSAE